MMESSQHSDSPQEERGGAGKDAKGDGKARKAGDLKKEESIAKDRKGEEKTGEESRYGP
jgi:hypothetical protein